MVKIYSVSDMLLLFFCRFCSGVVGKFCHLLQYFLLPKNIISVYLNFVNYIYLHYFVCVLYIHYENWLLFTICIPCS